MTNTTESIDAVHALFAELERDRKGELAHSAYLEQVGDDYAARGMHGVAARLHLDALRSLVAAGKKVVAAFDAAHAAGVEPPEWARPSVWCPIDKDAPTTHRGVGEGDAGLPALGPVQRGGEESVICQRCAGIYFPSESPKGCPTCFANFPETAQP